MHSFAPKNCRAVENDRESGSLGHPGGGEGPGPPLLQDAGRAGGPSFRDYPLEGKGGRGPSLLRRARGFLSRQTIADLEKLADLKLKAKSVRGQFLPDNSPFLGSALQPHKERRSYVFSTLAGLRLQQFINWSPVADRFAFPGGRTRVTGFFTDG